MSNVSKNGSKLQSESDLNLNLQQPRIRVKAMKIFPLEAPELSLVTMGFAYNWQHSLMSTTTTESEVTAAHFCEWAATSSGLSHSREDVPECTQSGRMQMCFRAGGWVGSARVKEKLIELEVQVTRCTNEQQAQVPAGCATHSRGRDAQQRSYFPFIFSGFSTGCPPPLQPLITFTDFTALSNSTTCVVLIELALKSSNTLKQHLEDGSDNLRQAVSNLKFSRFQYKVIYLTANSVHCSSTR